MVPVSDASEVKQESVVAPAPDVQEHARLIQQPLSETGRSLSSEVRNWTSTIFELPSDAELTPLLLSSSTSQLPPTSDLPTAAKRPAIQQSSVSLPFEMGMPACAPRSAPLKRKHEDDTLEDAAGASLEGATALIDLANSRGCVRFQKMLQDTLKGADACTVSLMGPAAKAGAADIVDVLMCLSPRQLNMLHPPTRLLARTILDRARSQMWRDAGFGLYWGETRAGIPELPSVSRSLAASSSRD